MKLDSKLGFRLVFYFAGQLLVAFGVAFAIKSNLGISPVSSPSYAIFNVLKFRGIESISYGTCVTAVYLLYVVIQIILLRRDFKPINLLQIAVSTVFGWFVNFTTGVVGPANTENYFIRLCFLAVAIVLIAIGISFYLGAKILPMPSEGMGLAITDKLKKYPYHKVKVVLDCIFVGSAVLITLIGAGRVIGVREGTILTAILVGRVMGLLRPVIDPVIQRWGFEKAAAATGA